MTQQTSKKIEIGNRKVLIKEPSFDNDNPKKELTLRKAQKRKGDTKNFGQTIWHQRNHTVMQWAGKTTIQIYAPVIPPWPSEISKKKIINKGAFS